MLLDILEILDSDYGNPFDVNLGGVDYQMEVDKNIAGFLTVSLWDVDGNALVNGEKLVYGRRLFSSLNSDDYPDEDLVPLDPSGTENECNTDNFGVSVFLTYNDGPEDGAGIDTPIPETNQTSNADEDDIDDIDLEED